MTKFTSVWSILNHLVDTGIFPGAVHRICLAGPPGTGKSFAVRMLKRDYENVTLFPSQFTEYVLASQALRNGDTICIPGPIAKAAQEGKPIVIDEFDQFSPDVRTVLHAALDDFDQCRLTLPDGSNISPKPGYCVIATTNADPKGFPSALLDRFDLILNVNEPAPGIVESVSTVNPALGQYLGQYYKDAYPGSFYFTPPTPMSSRTALRFARLTNAGLDKDVALSLVFGQHAPTIANCLV